MTSELYEMADPPLSINYDYDEGEPEMGIPPSVTIMTIWYEGKNVLDLLLAICPDWVERIEDALKNKKSLF